ncbi:hypothetical protein [Salinicoccus roseus]|uniref:Uncharacterized protein n=1 Tax=Salinicoccus roseus TaxID=45670 RepID=A0A0C2DJ97_9STAP|nr:hypothetical protein [Salinicoccus roseus]KIH70053.1 hypothetical protein SN16_11160 [Salinicoccus roseus]MDB0581361.1 hypothetical protein [Salinicoccus roseus]
MTTQTLFTGLLHRKHLYFGTTCFATAIPGRETIRIMVHKYQNVLPKDTPNMTYLEYEKWLIENDFEERENLLL